jgi:hypothetical protein
VSLNNFDVSQLAHKLESLALATPQTTRIRPDSALIEDEFDFKERPDSADSDSGRPVTSNDSSIYRSFIGDSVENQQLDSLDFSSTLCNDDINESGGNIESMHESLASVNLDLVSFDFEDSSHNITVQSVSNKSSEDIQNISNNSNLNSNNSTPKQINSLMDGIESETKCQVKYMFLHFNKIINNKY